MNGSIKNMPEKKHRNISETMNIAFYNFSHWFTNETNHIDFRDMLTIPCEGEIVPYKEAEIIFIHYGGNADHIPFLAALFEQYPHKKFVLVSGEYLRRIQALIPKKISTKATHAVWAKKLFPSLYPMSHIFFPFPHIKADYALYNLLVKYKKRGNILSVLCEDSEALGEMSVHYPLFIRDIIASFIPQSLMSNEYSASHRLTTLNTALHPLTPQVSIHTKNAKHEKVRLDNTRDIFCSTIFGNTTKERVLACKKISKIGTMSIYGQNPISTYGAFKGDINEIYKQSLYGLCFENISADGYITEKLFNIIKNQAIPIYWGDPKISRYCNTDAMIYCSSRSDIYSLHKQVKETNARIKDIAQTPYFLDEHIKYIAESYEKMSERLKNFLFY